MKIIILTMTLWLAVLTTSPIAAQIKALPSGEMYVNGGIETVFIMPRGSLERLLVKAQGFDSIAPLFAPLVADTALVRAENRLLGSELGSERREKWFIGFVAAILGVALLFK